ncbi:Non-repetitive/WGA-negative nucleoporin C-terminal-domain-containing protein [Hyaloraphidium curvatum]|nr:Non-repetitive/WGA-negative nucleoporin C-terminal-domain-containing protein [Hyaloraphidium curvatum]
MFSFQTPRARRAAAARRSPLSVERERDAFVPPAAREAAPPSPAPSAFDAPPPPPRAEPPVYWTKNDVRALSVAAPLPLDALDAVVRAEESGEPSGVVRGFADPYSGWALVAVGNQGFAWSVKDRIRRLPQSNVLQFLSHDSLVCLIPRGENSPYTAALACTADGKLRFWDQMSVGVDRFRSTEVILDDGEVITTIANCEPIGIILATSNGRLIRVSVPSGATDFQTGVSAEFIERARGGIFSRVGSLFGSSSSQRTHADEVVAIVPGKDNARTARNVFVVGTRTLKRWIVSRSGGHDLVYDEDIGGLLVENICRDIGVDPELAEGLSLRVLDAAINNNNQLILLVSYVVDDSVVKFSAFWIDCEWTPSEPTPLLDRKDFAVQRHVDDPVRTSLVVPSGGPALAIVFEDAVVLSTTDVAQPYEETLPFSDRSHAVRERIVGHGARPPSLVRDDAQLRASMLLCFSRSGAVLVEFDLGNLDDSSVPKAESIEEPTVDDEMLEAEEDDKEVRGLQALRNQIEQAIFFAQEQNPLAFRLDASLSGNLDTAVSQISNSIVRSKIKYIDEIVQTKMQLTEKQVRLDALASFLRDNGALARVSPGVRKELCWNAEKVAAALRGWRFREAQAGRQGPAAELLPAAVASYLDRKRIRRGNDVQDNIRTFFKDNVEYIGDLFTELQLACKRYAESRDSASQLPVLVEANKILIGLYEAALQYRAAHSQAYMLEDGFLSEPWTCTESMITVFHDQIFATFQALQAPGVASQSAAMDVDLEEADGNGSSLADQLREQMAPLASNLLASFTERIRFMESQLPATTTATAQLKDRYVDLRSRVIQNLVKLGKPDVAFGLADAYEDFGALSDLIFSAPPAKREADVRLFANKYQHAFTDVFFGKLVEGAKFAELLQQPDELSDYLTAFFDSRTLPGVAWMHFVRVGDLERAARSLSASAKGEAGAGGRLVALNLAKLAVAASDPDEVFLTGSPSNKELELLALESRLAESCESVAADFKETMDNLVPVHQEPAGFDAKLEKLVELTCAGDERVAALAELYRSLLGQLMKGNVVTVEELVDILTLRMGDAESEYDSFRSALAAIAELNMLVPNSKRRQDTLLAIWRRAILRNDWRGIDPDNDAEERLQNTVVYALMMECLEEGLGIYLPRSVRHMLEPPLLENTKARFPLLSELEVDRIWQAIEHECNTVKRLVDDHDLETLYKTTLQTAERDFQAGASGEQA